MVRFMLYFFLSVQKCKKRKYFWHVPRWNYLSLLHVERYILIWNFLHCQYLIYETTKCYLRFWKISSEIGPFFKDNLLPVNIRARVSLSVCVYQVVSLLCLNTVAICRRPSNLSVLSSDGIYQTSSIKVYSLWSSSR